MNSKEYNKNVILAIICNVISLFILGYVFSAISYGLFDKNYKNSLNNRQKRNFSIIGKVISSFFFFMSCSYHGQSRSIPLDERMVTSGIVGLIFAVVNFFILKSRDKKIILENDEIIEELKCSNCGVTVSENAIKCPNCGAEFVDEDNVTIEEEYFQCSNCGARVDEAAKKCPNCGLKFDDDDTEKDNTIDKKYESLTKLKKLLDKNIITKEEFEKEKRKILK